MYKRNLRLIPKIEIKNSNLVKGINFEGLRALGDPDPFIESYYKKGADEISIIDVSASLYETTPNFSLIKKITRDKFIPFIYGGNLKSLKDIEKILNCGIDKVYLNSSIIKNLSFLKDSIKYFGASTIVLGVETQTYLNDHYIFSKFGREFSGIKLDNWISRCLEVGVGEIMISSIINDGLQKGLDINTLSRISKNLNVPIIASGGFGSFEDIRQILKYSDCTGIAISTALHYYEREKLKNIKLSNIGNYSYHEKSLNYAKDKFKKIDLIDLVKFRDELNV